MNIDNNNGTDVQIAKSFQLFNHKAIQGILTAPVPKNKAIDIFAINVRHDGPTYSNTIIGILNCYSVRYCILLPNMYIIVKQLSKANPTKNRQIVKLQKLFVNAVAMPAIAPKMFAPIRDGILP